MIPLKVSVIVLSVALTKNSNLPGKKLEFSGVFDWIVQTDFCLFLFNIYNYRWMPPEFDQVMNVRGWGKQKKVSPLIIANVQATVLVHSGRM